MKTHYRKVGKPHDYVRLMPKKNPFKPENIKVGDKVWLRDPKEGDHTGHMIVQHIGGSNQNKIFCNEIGYELYASCFRKEKK
jgi:hypothetical protein